MRINISKSIISVILLEIFINKRTAWNTVQKLQIEMEIKKNGYL